ELPGGRVSGAEALVRWQHPTRGLLYPDAFIGVAEESDLISEIGGWVLRTAAAHAAAWERRWGSRFSVSVNLAARQLRTPAIVSEVAAVLHDSQIAPESLILEITEGGLMGDSRPIEATLNSL